MKKLLSILVCIIMLLGMMAPAMAEEKTTLTIMYMDESGQENQEDTWFYKWIMSAYEKWDKKDSVELELLPQNGSSADMFTKANLMMQSPDTCPDIYMDDSFQAVSDAAAGYLLDLTDYLAGWETWNDGSVFEASKAMLQLGEGTYGIPYSTDGRGLWVNTEILEAAGLGKDWEPASWEELLNGLYQIKENCEGVTPFWARMYANSESTSMNTYEMILFGTEDHLYDWETGKWNARSQGMLDSLNLINTIVDDGLTGSVAELVSRESEPTAFELMSQGKLAMFLGGSWVANRQFGEGRSFEWPEYTDVLKLIKMPKQAGDGYITMSGGWALTIPANSDNADLAFEFISSMMDDVDGYCTFAIDNDILTPRNVSEAARYADYVANPYTVEANAFLEWTEYRPQQGAYSEISSYISQMVEAVVAGTEPEQAMEDFAWGVIGIVGEENTQSMVH